MHNTVFLLDIYFLKFICTLQHGAVHILKVFTGFLFKEQKYEKIIRDEKS